MTDIERNVRLAGTSACLNAPLMKVARLTIFPRRKVQRRRPPDERPAEARRPIPSLTTVTLAAGEPDPPGRYGDLRTRPIN